MARKHEIVTTPIRQLESGEYESELAFLKAQVKEHWALCCDYDQVPANVKFVVFSDNNTFVTGYQEALEAYWQHLRKGN